MSQMPMVAHPPTKPNGDAYTQDDRQFWELHETHLPDNIRGIRQYQYFAYPRMLFKALTGGMQRDAFDRKTVQTEREHQALIKDEPAWCESKTAAAEYFDRGQRDVARAAAEAAASVVRMSEKARREYARASSESPRHVTDITE